MVKFEMRKRGVWGGVVQAEVTLIVDNAIRQLESFFPTQDEAPKPAVVLDVDETALTAIAMLR